MCSTLADRSNAGADAHIHEPALTVGHPSPGAYNELPTCPACPRRLNSVRQCSGTPTPMSNVGDNAALRSEVPRIIVARNRPRTQRSR